MAEQKKLKIVADKHIPYLKGVLEALADISYLPAREITSSVVRDADALIVRTRTRCGRELLKGSKVRFIASATSGTDHLDFDYCREQGIACQNAPGCNASSVAQYLAAAFIQIAEKEQRSFNELTLGIIGVGHVGEKVRQVGESLGMNVLLNDPPRERKEKSSRYTDLEYLLETADIISLHVPLNRSGRDQTVGLVDRNFLKLMKPGAWLINTSRGEVGITKDLVNHSSDKNYIFDVWENEPHLNATLLSKAMIATPHIAGYSVNGKANATRAVVRALSNYFNWDLDDFEPDIPLPEKNRIKPLSGNDFEELKEIVKHTYYILHDDRLLRENPGSFEALRGNYRKRWEFDDYTVLMRRNSNRLALVVDKLGFNLQIRENNDT